MPCRSGLGYGLTCQRVHGLAAAVHVRDTCRPTTLIHDADAAHPCVRTIPARAANVLQAGSSCRRGSGCTIRDRDGRPSWC